MLNQIVKDVLSQVIYLFIECSQYGEFKICEASAPALLSCQNGCVEICGVDVCMKTENTNLSIFISIYL